MKNIIIKCIVIVLAFGLFSCQQFKDIATVGDIQNISATIKINAKVSGDIPSPDSYKIKLNNYTEGLEFIREVKGGNLAAVNDIIPGIYNITVSSEVSHNGFTYNFNGNIANTNILMNGQEIVIDVEASKSGNIILKEIFYCGSRTPKNGTYFRDQFYELYNNSGSVQYLDGLCIGNMQPLSATADMPVWPGENPDDYIYFSTIWQIPGDPAKDKAYPLKPGESIVIAQMADNHQRVALNPSSPVNLIGAEFETLLKTTSLILDNPAINMYMAFWPKTAPQWLTTVNGPAMAIFIPKQKIDPNDIIIPIGKTLQAYKVSVNDIIDAVEMVPDESKMKLKRVPAILDAGAATVSETYCTKSISRKIKETLPDGRIIFMDTNNSTEDFQVEAPPVVRRHNVKTPSWNTWAK